jgi:hypothetical protein
MDVDETQKESLFLRYVTEQVDFQIEELKVVYGYQLSDRSVGRHSKLLSFTVRLMLVSG